MPKRKPPSASIPSILAVKETPHSAYHNDPLSRLNTINLNKKLIPLYHTPLIRLLLIPQPFFPYPTSSRPSTTPNGKPPLPPAYCCRPSPLSPPTKPLAYPQTLPNSKHKKGHRRRQPPQEPQLKAVTSLSEMNSRAPSVTPYVAKILWDQVSNTLLLPI